MLLKVKVKCPDFCITCRRIKHFLYPVLCSELCLCMCLCLCVVAAVLSNRGSSRHCTVLYCTVLHWTVESCHGIYCSYNNRTYQLIVSQHQSRFFFFSLLLHTHVLSSRPVISSVLSCVITCNKTWPAPLGSAQMVVVSKSAMFHSCN